MTHRTIRRRAAFRAVNGHRRTRPRIILRILLLVLVAFTMLTSGASAATMLFYGDSLPSIQKFKSQFQFQNTVFYDRQGKVLYDMADLSHAGGARRIVEPLFRPGHPTQYYQSRKEDWLVGDDPCQNPKRQDCSPSGTLRKGIPLALQNATIATEDATFYTNLGFDPLSIARAEYDNLTTGHIVSGASTITQQLVKQYLVGDKQTISRKTEEIILAAELTQKYPKSKILWYYLNSVSYGNLSTGAEAAAKAYFNKDVWDLDPAQCALLAGLPEAPSVYDPVNNRPAALNRMRYVLHLMYIHGYLKTNGQPEPSLIDQYMAEANKWPVFRPQLSLKTYPHFVEYAIQQMQSMPELKGKIYQGLAVYTTVDERLQQAAQQTVRDQVSQLGSYNVTDGALVSMSLQPDCYGCIRAMVGSADYNNKAIAGQINMANTPRQPGSSFKPFNYIWAFRNGLGPGTTVLDAPIAIPDTGNPDDGGWYEPTNYDHTYHGVVTLRTALQNSLNIPAVKVEQFGAGVNSKGLQNIENQAVELGMKSLPVDNPNCCGWALTLGGMERGTRLVEETAAYGAFGSNGYIVPPTAIVQVRDRTTGAVLWDLNKDAGYAHRQPAFGANSRQYAYLMNNVLSDNDSRCLPQVCEFGLDSPLNLGRPAAAKTGTTNSFTDNWTLGYTPDIVTGVWVGNADNSPMVGTTGVTGAAPIWHDYMLKAFDILNLPPKNFVEPPGIYSGSLCREPDSYGSPGTGVFDIWTGIEPLCSVGSYNTSLPVPQQNTPYQPPAQNPIVAPPAAPPAVAPTQAPQIIQQPAPTAPPVIQPRSAPPVVQQPPAQQPPVQQPPVQQPPVQQPPAVQPPASGTTP